MKKIISIVAMMAICLIATFNISAQSKSEMAAQIVTEYVKALNSPEVKANIESEGYIKNYSASSKGNVVIINATLNIPGMNFNELSQREKNELTGSFSEGIYEGMPVANGSTSVVDVFHQLDIKIEVRLKDLNGNTITGLTTF